MNADRWRALETICEQAWACAPDSRPAFLDQACASDVELRAEVESLLAQESAAHAFFEIPLGVVGDREPLRAGTTLGSYEVLGIIGSGGMGRVYLQPHRQQLYLVSGLR